MGANIPQLAIFFQSLAAQKKKRILELPQDLLHPQYAYAWPGVDEPEQVIIDLRTPIEKEFSANNMSY